MWTRNFKSTVSAWFPMSCCCCASGTVLVVFWNYAINWRQLWKSHIVKVKNWNFALRHPEREWWAGFTAALERYMFDIGMTATVGKFSSPEMSSSSHICNTNMTLKRALFHVKSSILCPIAHWNQLYSRTKKVLANHNVLINFSRETESFSIILFSWMLWWN